MSVEVPRLAEAAGAEWLRRGGEMAERIRAFDWSRTSLGPLARWPSHLRTTVQTCLESRHPIVLYWGGDYVLLYNDAWRPIVGAKHPDALGRSARQVWAEIWDPFGLMLESVRRTGEATWSDDQLLPLQRYGFTEECYFSYSLSPVRDEAGAVAGIFTAVTETTGRFIGERRLGLLRELADRTADAQTDGAACQLAVEALRGDPADIPFALIYLTGAAGKLELRAAAGVNADAGADGAAWPLTQVLGTESALVVKALDGERLGLSGGPWPEVPHTAVVLPIPSAGHGAPAGVLVAGVSPRQPFNDAYRGFLELAAGHVGTAVARAQAYERERKRAEALAELDRAKTTFFSNVSHEFRTPLTLMLGPLEDAAAKADRESRELLALAQRNGQRLLKLVNTLLDFARIEAGRAQASYAPTELSKLTAELASNFRSACERAGLALEVDCAPSSEPAYVDREMWEKIVLNLLSNAFKFTLRGGIFVALREAGGAFELRVRDTGSGIPAADLPRMFERFHRVEGAVGRSHEGSGIGLALVQELVKLHGGTISVESAPGRGSTFTVTIPKGSAHLPPERRRAPREEASTAVRADAFVDEALSWLPQAAVEAPRKRPGHAPRILLADDNADLRAYAHRLLAEHYEVEAVADGEAAMAAARARRPDLIVSDVMMPRLDGFGLLRELRADENLRTVPVILLSARAGEEARIEGLGKGADDYLVKPFNARELLVRADALLRTAGVRREAEEALRESENRLRTFADTAPASLWVSEPDGTCSFLSRGWYEYTGQAEGEGLGFGWVRAVHPDDRARSERIFTEANEKREPFSFEYRLRRHDGEYRWAIDSGRPRFGPAGEYLGFVGSVIDVHERRLAEERVRENEERLRAVVETTPECVKIVSADGTLLQMNPQGIAMVGASSPKAVLGRCVYDLIAPEHRERFRAFNERICRGERGSLEFDIVGVSGQRRHMETHAAPLRQADGSFAQLALTRDVTERRRGSEALRESERTQRFLAEIGALGARTGVAGGIQIDELVRGIVERIGAHLAASRCGLSRVDLAAGQLVVEHDACTAGLASLKGEYAIERYAGHLVGHGQAGRTTVIADLAADPRTAERYARTYEPIGVRAYISVPLHRAGAWVANLWVSSHEPREWTEQEVRFMETVADRVWLVIEQARVATALAESEKRYRAVVESQAEMVCRFRPEGPILFANAAYARAAGTTPEALVGRPFWEFVTQEDRPTVRAMLARLTPEAPEVRIENRFDTAQGERWTLWTNRAISFDREGKVLEAQSTGIDISERRQAEAALQESDRRKDEFIATLSHELRNPLAPLRNALHLLRLSGKGEGAGVPIVEMMERQVNHLVRLVDDLLEMSRISRGAFELQKSRIDVATIVANAVETSEPLIHAARHRLRVALPKEALWVDGDGVRLAQVLSNLLNNAAKYTDQGGEITLEVQREGSRVAIAVRDNGPGIEPEALPGLFEMFSRGDHVSGRQQGGLGIGLALARRLAEMHGGTLQGRSEGRGKGAEFTLRLPLAEARARPLPGERAEQAALPPRRVLVVDDNRDAADSLGMLLKFLGADVRLAYAGMEALEAFQAYEPSIVLLDVGMPGMDGYEVARRMRERQNGRHVPIVAVTGWGQEEDRRRTRAAGFDHHLVKPADISALQTLLSAL